MIKNRDNDRGTLSSDDMIQKFLKEKSVTVCPDATLIKKDNSRRSSTRTAQYDLVGISGRTAKKFHCEICNWVDNVVSHSGQFGAKGQVGGIYKGDVWCSLCRLNENEKIKKLKLVQKENEKLEYKCGSKAKFIEYTNLLNLDSSDIKELLYKDLIVLQKKLNWAIRIKSSKKMKYILALVNSKIKLNNDVDWDDWDTPLHSDIQSA